jgi:hypothetical protein
LRRVKPQQIDRYIHTDKGEEGRVAVEDIRDHKTKEKKKSEPANVKSKECKNGVITLQPGWLS